MQRQGPGGAGAAVSLRTAGGLLLVAHLAVVAWFTLRPLDVPWVMPANLRLFAGIRADLALGWPTAAWRIGKELALLAPLGVLLPMAGGRVVVSPLMSLLRTATAGALISLGIELLQTSVPGQVVDIDSLLLNTVGVALLHVAVVPAARARLRRRGASTAGDEGHTGKPGRPERSQRSGEPERSERPERSRKRGRVRGRPEASGSRADDAVSVPWTRSPGGADHVGHTGGRGDTADRTQGLTPTIPRVGIAP